MTKVAVLDDYHGLAHEFADWDSLGPEVTVSFFPRIEDVGTLVATLKDYEIICLMRERTPLPQSVLEHLPKLRLVCTTGMRNASVDADYLSQRGIPLVGAGGGDLPGGPVELAWSLIFALAKRTILEDKAMRAGTWQLDMPTVLGGKTLGLLGLGRLGGAMVAPAVAFGMDVIAWSQNLTVERTQALGVTHVSKSELFERSDVLSIHLVLGERTRALVGKAELDLMKSTALLVNTSRGPIVEENALVEALRAHRIAGAGLDVFDVEPLPADHPFFSLENTVLSPHIGYVSRENFRVGYGQAVEAVQAFLEGTILRQINKA